MASSKLWIQLRVLLLHRKRIVYLAPPSQRWTLCLCHRIVPDLLIRLPIDPDAPPLPEGERGEIDVVLKQYLMLKAHGLPMQDGRGVAGALSGPAQRPIGPAV